MYNPSQVSISPTYSPPIFPTSSTESSYLTNRPIVLPTTIRNISTPSYADKVRNIITLTHTSNTSTSTQISHTTRSCRTNHLTRTTPTSTTLSTATYKNRLRTNHISTIRGYSQDSSILLSVDSDATKEIFFLNLQPVNQNLLATRKADKEEMLPSVTAMIKGLQHPTIGFFKMK